MGATPVDSRSIDDEDTEEFPTIQVEELPQAVVVLGEDQEDADGQEEVGDPMTQDGHRRCRCSSSAGVWGHCPDRGLGGGQPFACSCCASCRRACARDAR